MGNKFILFFIVLLLSVRLYGQEDTQLKLKHLKGFQGVKAGVAYNKLSVTSNFGYNYYVRRNFFISPSFNYDAGFFKRSDFKYWYFDFNANYTLYSIGDFMYFSLGGAAFVGNEKKVEEETNAEKKDFIKGLYVNALIEYFPMDFLSFNVYVRENVQAGSNLGSSFLLIGIQAQYNFN